MNFQISNFDHPGQIYFRILPDQLKKNQIDKQFNRKKSLGFSSFLVFAFVQQIKQMIKEKKAQLPYVMNGICTKLHSLFMKKLILYDSEILQAKHLRHYDYECEGLFTLINFLQRKTNKNEVLAFQKLKNYPLERKEQGEIITQEQQGQQTKKMHFKSSESMATPRTKFFTRANTSIEESDNSFFFSPNLKRNPKKACKTEYFSNSINVDEQRNEILEKLLNKVKKINSQAFQESLQHAKSSYFNLTLGKQSLQTFQNNSHDELPSNHKKESKQMKRRKILQKFQRIEQKIQDNPHLNMATQVTPISKIYINRTKAPNTTYSVYQRLNYDDQLAQVVYVTRNNKKKTQKEHGGSALSSSQSVTNINYARQVYL